MTSSKSWSTANAFSRRESRTCLLTCPPGKKIEHRSTWRVIIIDCPGLSDLRTIHLERKLEHCSHWKKWENRLCPTTPSLQSKWRRLGISRNLFMHKGEWNGTTTTSINWWVRSVRLILSGSWRLEPHRRQERKNWREGARGMKKSIRMRVYPSKNSCHSLATSKQGWNSRGGWLRGWEIWKMQWTTMRNGACQNSISLWWKWHAGYQRRNWRSNKLRRKWIASKRIEGKHKKMRCLRENTLKKAVKDGKKCWRRKPRLNWGLWKKK